MNFFKDAILDPGGIFTSGGGGLASSMNPLSDAPGGKKGEPQENTAANELAAIAKQLFNESTPLRRDLLSRSKSFMDGGLDVTQSPQYEGLKAGSDLNFNRARTNTISAVPAGGALTDALANLETGRAVQMAQGAGGIAESELSRALSLATGSTPAATSGLGAAAGIQAQQLEQQAARQSQAKQGAGAGAGALLAAFLA